MEQQVAEQGLDGFLAGLRRLGCEPQIRDEVVVFAVVPVGGSLAGKPVETGVSVHELTGWSGTPPHWVHFPGWISFTKTNSKPSRIEGWLQHSREARGWGNAHDPAQAWLAHVRAVLGGAC